MPIRPLYDKVVVRKNPAEKTTAGGIVITMSSQSSDRGTVLAVGAGHVMQDGTQRPLTVKVGDTVLLSHAGNAITVDGEEVFVFLESDLIGIVE